MQKNIARIILLVYGTMVISSCVQRDSAMEIAKKAEELSAQMNLFTEGSASLEVSVYDDDGEKKKSMQVPTEMIKGIFETSNISPLHVEDKIMTAGGFQFSCSKGVLGMGKYSGNIYKIDHTYFQFKEIPDNSEFSRELLKMKAQIE